MARYRSLRPHFSWVCADCGALVWDKGAHDRFHDRVPGANAGDDVSGK